MTAPFSADPHLTEPLVLLVAADDAYALPLAVTLFSALEQLASGRMVKVYIADGGISSANRARIERVVRGPKVTLQLEWLTPDLRDLQALPLGSGEVAYLSQATYLRLFAPAVIPEAKVIYLDSDLLIQHDLEDLWKLDLAAYAAAAVPEHSTATLGRALSHIDKRYPLAPAEPYYNAGMLLINLDKWRAENVATAVFAVIQEYREVIRYLDQDGLNVVLPGSWLRLEAKWNFQVNSTILRTEPLPLEDVFILHYSTRFKPWLKLALGLERPYYNRYLEVLKRSGWFSPLGYIAFYLRLALGSTSERTNQLSKRVLRRSRKR